jgi:Dolichyl-phosphate-mannose-protein mannosyltransferase
MGLACALKLLLALRTYGSNDVLYWEWFLDRLRQAGGVGLYHSADPANDAKIFNHPPFMIHLLRLMQALASATGIAFPFWLRLPAIVADLGATVLVWRLLAPRLGRDVSPGALVLLAAAPPAIMISGFHGNTDPLMICCVLLSVYLVERRRPAWLAGAAFGMAMNVKVVPLIFAAAILLYLPDVRERLAYLTAAALVFLAGSLPYLIQDPVFIARRVFGYGSFAGDWGLTRLLASLPPGYEGLGAAYAHRGRFAVLAVVVAVSFWLNRSPHKPPLFLQCGLVAYLFMALSPGFGVQYLAWLVPWVVGLGLGPALLYYAASGAFLVLVYTYWSQGFPWYLADSGQVGAWPDYASNAGLLCWAVVVVILVLYLRRLAPAPTEPRRVSPLQTGAGSG